MKCRLCLSEFKNLSETASPITVADVTISKRTRREIPLVQCDQCDLVQVAAMEAPEAITQLYQKLEDEDFESEADNRRASFGNDLTKIRNHALHPQRILEIGAFTGNSAGPIAAFFPQSYYLGIEPSVWASKRAQNKGFNVIASMVGDSLQEKNFDLIVSWDVVEHLEHPHDLFKWLESLQTEKGFLFLNTPDWNSAWRKLFGKNWWFVLPMHRTYFTKETLAKLAAQYDWTLVDSWSHKKFRSLPFVVNRVLEIFRLPQFGSSLPKINLPLQPGQMACLFQKKS